MRGSHPPRLGESGKGVLWDTYLTGEGRTSYGVKKQDTAVNMLPVLFFIMGRIDPVIQKSPFHYNRGVQATIRERKGDFMAKQTNSLAHTKWMCKYHIIFTPKYRRKIVYNQYKTDLRDILKQLCSYKGVEILEGHLMPDHEHMLVSIPPKISVSSFMGYLKGKSALMMFDRHANLKYKFGNRHFWSEGYYVSTVGLNEATIKKYIQEQEKADIIQDKLSVKEYEDPFKGQG